ncbi:MAG: hypothetical protein IPN23_07815 [Elusimicrobia bacterium]|nr:hypothetical protein [Elusimicrobiota bacterium]
MAGFLAHRFFNNGGHFSQIFQGAHGFGIRRVPREDLFESLPRGPQIAVVFGETRGRQELRPFPPPPFRGFFFLRQGQGVLGAGHGQLRRPRAGALGQSEGSGRLRPLPPVVKSQPLVNRLVLNGREAPFGPGGETSIQSRTLGFGLIQAGGFFQNTVQGVGGFQQSLLGNQLGNMVHTRALVGLDGVAPLHAHPRVADDAGGVGGAQGVGLFFEFARRPVKGPA